MRQGGKVSSGRALVYATIRPIAAAAAVPPAITALHCIQPLLCAADEAGASGGDVASLTRSRHQPYPSTYQLTRPYFACSMPERRARSSKKYVGQCSNKQLEIDVGLNTSI